ncbi:transporter [Plantibacter sp. Mn2098]|uniref:SLAC1 family transporter n=1 Tax=Plantibacter sp. Mn2098 TaxID=3395266 RepID=UPI003BBE4915
MTTESIPIPTAAGPAARTAAGTAAGAAPGTAAGTVAAPGASPTRIPFVTLAISIGLAGLAGDWSIAGRLLGVPPVIGNVVWIIAAIAWVWLIVAHLVRGRRSADSLGDQLRHPAQGPIGSLAPTVGMLLGAKLADVAPLAGEIVVVVMIAVAAVFAAWILGHWASGRVQAAAIHGGYFLPTVAAGLVAAGAAAKVGLPTLAIGALAVGVFFWIVMSVIIIARLAFLPPLPDALVPTLAIIAAPPAVAGEAVFAMSGGAPTGLAAGAVSALIAITVVMAGMQIALVRRYRYLPFGLGFWSFTFAYAAVVGFVMEWLAFAAFPGWQIIAAVLLGLISVFIGVISVRSIALVVLARRRTAG